MSPRRNHPRRRDSAPAPLDEEKARRGIASVQSHTDGDWHVRHLPGAADPTKVYRCPGCDLPVAAGVPHVVAWPADGRGDLTDRRHWHTGCWQARERRGPTRRQR